METALGDKTGIGWTDATWNPIAGCTRVSPGCANCYALTLHNRRYKANVKAGMMWSGLQEEAPRRRIVGSEGWPQNVKRVGPPPEGWAARGRSLGVRMPMPPQYDLPFTKVQLLPERLDQPPRWRRPRRIFVNSMSDLFHEDVPFEFIDRVFGAMLAAKRNGHRFQILTKRPERMHEYVTREWKRTACGDRFEETYSHVWLGVSVEDQERADERIPLLLDTPAAARFISAEPLLGALDVTPWLGWDACQPGEVCGRHARLSWVIAGGESGGPPERRLVQECAHRGFQRANDLEVLPCKEDCYRCHGAQWEPTPDGLAWVSSLRDQCAAAGVPFFLKQWGGLRPTSGGRLLDGREWNQFPDGTGSGSVAAIAKAAG